MAAQWLATVARLGRRAMLMLVVGVLWTIAFGLALASATVWLAGAAGAVAAMAIVAVFLVVAALLIHVFVMNRRTEPQAPAHTETARLAGPALSPEGEDEGMPMSDGAALASVAVLGLAGYVLGRMARQP